MRKFFLWYCFIVLSTPVFSQVKNCIVWWTENGVPKTSTYINAGQTFTLNRDPGTTVFISVWKNTNAPTTSIYYCLDQGNTRLIQSDPITNGYYNFENAAGALATVLWLYVNDASSKITINVNNLVPQNPDLVVSNITFNGSTQPESYMVGQTINISCRVANLGSGTAGSNYLGYYIGSNANDYSNRVGRKSIITLDGLTGYWVDFDYTIQSSDVGTKYILLKADYQNDVVEVNENNNTAARGPSSIINLPVPNINLFSINNGQSTTTTRFVTLNNNCSNSPTHFMASENQQFNGSTWQPYSNSPNFTLSLGNGSKTVYFKTKNSYGESSPTQDQIYLNLPTIPYGTTIITHGYYNIMFQEPIEAWMIPMAEAIRGRLSGNADIYLYDKVTGDFLPINNVTNIGEKILLFDWKTDSNTNQTGLSEAAADALFAALMNAFNKGLVTLDNLHFIGHSRGCVVNSEVVERLLKHGFSVDQVTNLDPHDWGGISISVCDDTTDVNWPLVIDYPTAHKPNRGIVSWQGVNKIDTYWRQNNDLLDLNGREVNGSYNLRLDDALSHGNVCSWYIGTIDGSSGEPSWYGGIYPLRTETGYNYSKYGNLVLPIATGNKNPLFDYFKWQVYNGDFPFDASAPYFEDEVPGWKYHGGEGNGFLDDGHLDLDYGDGTRTHNRFYVPPNAVKLWFKYKVNNKSLGSIPDTDKLKVSILTESGTETVLDDIWLNQKTGWVLNSFNVVEFSNSVVRLKFEIVPDGIIDSEVWIDDIQFELTNENTIPFTPIASTPIDSGSVNSLQPLFEWSTFKNGGDGNNQSGYQIRVRDNGDNDRIVYETGFISSTSDNSHTYAPGSFSGIDPITGETRISENLQWNRYYHWHIRYRDSSGDWSAWSHDDPNPHQNFLTTQLIPTILVEPTNLASFGNIGVGQNSEPKSYLLSAVNLSNNLVVNAPAGFQISLTNGNQWTIGNLTLIPSSGTIAQTPIWVRFSPINVTNYNTSISNSTTGATTQTVSVQGSGVSNLSPTITASAGSNGTITPVGTIAVNSGSNMTFTIAPNIGYQVENVIVDGVNQGSINSYSFYNITANHSISVTFKVATYTITATNMEPLAGTLTPSGNIVVDYGISITFSMQLHKRWYVYQVVVDGINVGSMTSYSFTNVTSNHSIEFYSLYRDPIITLQSVANIKLYLEGPFNSGTMSTALRDKGLITLSQPFNQPPWDYLGTENVANIPAGVVDWILLELRSSLDNYTVITRQAAFLKNDGSIVGLNNSEFSFINLTNGSYYLAIYHRNHLAIISSNPINFNTGLIASYDFTDSQSKAYTTGQDPMKDLGGGKYGMFSSDANADGIIAYIDDLLINWIPYFGLDGYYSADFNMNGTVDYDNDVMSKWLSNFGFYCQVPGFVNIEKLKRLINPRLNLNYLGGEK